MGSVALENGLDLNQVLHTGSILKINEDYHEDENETETTHFLARTIDFIGEPVNSFAEFEKELTSLEATEDIKKKILEPGGGYTVHKGCTVYIAFSGYFENESEPFDLRKADKPLIVDLNDSGLLPGLQVAVESMLVGELSVFLFPYQLMYGELGIPPRIKPKADCVFYIKLIKSTLTPKESQLDLKQPNTFERVYHEVKKLYASGATLYKAKNYTAAIQLFRKGEYMLHKCRLADEEEEKKQEKMLIKIYTNLTICYNAIRQPLRACIACNELNRLKQLYNNGKVLFQNSKALRMIGEYDEAEKKLKRAQKLLPDRKEIQEEFEKLQRTRDSCDRSKLVMDRREEHTEVSEVFKKQVDKLIKNFKEDDDLRTLTLPDNLSVAEIEYLKEYCTKQQLFINKGQEDFALGKQEASEEDNRYLESVRVHGRLTLDDPNYELL